MQPLSNSNTVYFSHLQFHSKDKMLFTCNMYVSIKKYPATYTNIVFSTALVG